MATMIQRLDGAVQGLINEVRAEHSRHDRLDARLRKLKSERESTTSDATSRS